MAEQNSMGEFFENMRRDKVVDMNNPSCKRCNECCGVLTILSDAELKNIRKYITQNMKGKAVYKAAQDRIFKYAEKGVVYMVCPFSDENKRCGIYFIRPGICREFHCKAELNRADRDLVARPHTIADLFVEQYRTVFSAILEGKEVPLLKTKNDFKVKDRVILMDGRSGIIVEKNPDSDYYYKVETKDGCGEPTFFKMFYADMKHA